MTNFGPRGFNGAGNTQQRSPVASSRHGQGGETVGMTGIRLGWEMDSRPEGLRCLNPSCGDSSVSASQKPSPWHQPPVSKMEKRWFQFLAPCQVVGERSAHNARRKSHTAARRWGRVWLAAQMKWSHHLRKSQPKCNVRHV